MYLSENVIKPPANASNFSYRSSGCCTRERAQCCSDAFAVLMMFSIHHDVISPACTSKVDAFVFRCALCSDTILAESALIKPSSYGLIDFAGMCMTSDTDQKRICAAVRQAIERHEPRLHRVTATLQPRKGAINRVDFVITAELKNAPVTEPMQFNAVFQPSLQRYSVQSVRGAS